MFKKLFKKQLASVIEYKNVDSSALFEKIKLPTDEVKNASKLIIAPGQGAILVYEGKIENVLNEPGIYEIKTSNHPFVTTLSKLTQMFESEHKLSIYFYQKTEIVNQKWGTSSPIKYLDPKYKFPVELGAYGTYSFKIEEPKAFFENIVGASRDLFSKNNMKELLASRISPEIASLIAKLGYSYDVIDANLSDLCKALKISLNEIYASLGLNLTDIRIEATSFSNETNDRISKVSDMSAEIVSANIAGLDYVELEKIRALRDAAKNEGGLAGAGLQIGAGLEIGKSFGSEILSNNQKSNEQNIDYMAQLKNLKMLLDDGILTQEEFDVKKKAILEKM